VERRLTRFRSFLTRGLTIFVFHEITDAPSEFQRTTDGYTSPSVFEAQMTWIGNRFDFISPVDLPQFGAPARLPERAALITFDDAWPGVFRTALPILASRGIPSLCFINMATVAGDPDLAAVRRYEERMLPAPRRRLESIIAAEAAPALLAEIRDVYARDSAFTAYQGPTATTGDLRHAADTHPVWFASHLYHHWDVTKLTPELFAASLRENSRALSEFDNTLAALATPYGADIPAANTIPPDLAIRVVFVAHGGQNRVATSAVLDRVMLEPEPSGPADWWYAAHRRRLFGTLVN
jgi:peptidoglycan/xylan/chitin deacetylase (PgdA/CDA1 family)